jgi:hypothetical protein
MDEFVRAVEATLFASASPLSPEEIGAYAGEGDVAAALAALAETYAGHGIELVTRGGRWHFQTAPDLAHIARARSRGGCRAPQPRRWRSSPITNRSAAPRSRRSAGCRSRRARSTC